MFKFGDIVENGWAYPRLVGQRIVIHAAARAIKPDEIEHILSRINDRESGLVEELALPILTRLKNAYKCQGVLELSAGLGTAIIGKPRRVGDIFKGVIADSDRLDHSLFGWPLAEIVQFDHPKEMRGAQGFWNWPDRA